MKVKIDHRRRMVARWSLARGVKFDGLADVEEVVDPGHCWQIDLMGLARG
jgi:hypothetical protein